MDELRFQELLKKLDNASEMLTKFSPSPSPAEQTSVGMITKDTDVLAIPELHIPVVHSMLHMFYSNKSGRGLPRKSIEKLHKELAIRMKTNHVKFDKLDLL